MRARQRVPAVVVGALTLLATLAAIGGSAAAADRPSPIFELNLVGCDADSCQLEWEPQNDLSTLRSWDIHVNDRYRTWVPISAGPTLEFGPGAADPRLRVDPGDRIEVIPVRIGGAYADTDLGASYVANDFSGDRPLPVGSLEQFGCDADSCSLRWTPGNPPGELRAWDVQVNGRYRTWVPIADGPSLAYGPGADDPRLRDVTLGDAIQIIPVRFDGSYTPTEQSPTFFVTDYGPDFGPGVDVADEDLGVVDVGATSVETVVFLAAAAGQEDGWGGPDAVVSDVQIVGADAGAFTIERYLVGEFGCPDCDRTEVDLPFSPTRNNRSGFGYAAMVTFTPDRAGLHEASLVVTHNGRDTPTTSRLAGTGTDSVEFGPGVEVASTDFGSVEVGDPFVDLEIPISALGGDEWQGPDAVVTSVEVTGGLPDVFEVLYFVEGQLSCPIENPDCVRTRVELPAPVFPADQNGFGLAAVVRFSPRTVGLSEATLVVSHNGTDSPTTARLSGIGRDGDDRPTAVTQLADGGCDTDVCSLTWEPTNDPASLRAWDIHVNGRYRTWVAIADGPSIEYGPGATDGRLRNLEPGDVIRVIPVRPDGVWASEAASATFTVPATAPSTVSG